MPPRGYPGPARSHPRARRGRPAGHGRPADQQGHRDAPAGALAVPRRHRGEGPQGVPVHQCRRRQGTQIRHPGRGRRARRQPRDLPHRHGLPLDEIDARWVKAAQHPIPPRLVEQRAVPRDRDRRARRSTSRATASTAFRCRSRRRAGTSRPTRRCRNTSPRTPTPASRTWAITAAR